MRNQLKRRNAGRYLPTKTTTKMDTTKIVELLPQMTQVELTRLVLHIIQIPDYNTGMELVKN